MKNVTLSLDELTLESAKGCAAKRGLSLNAFVKGLIEREIREPKIAWFDSAMDRAKRAGTRTADGKPLAREEIYRR